MFVGGRHTALEQLKIREIVRQAVGKNLDIPEFQWKDEGDIVD